MQRGDFDEFARLIDDSYDMISVGTKSLSPAAKAMFFRAVAKYPLDVFRAALHAHLLSKDGMFCPQPAHIIKQIEEMAQQDGRPGAEEAWAIALTSQDEADTVVWTLETAKAFTICRPVLESSGAISARKAFIEAYERIVAEARKQCVAPEWSASLGWDKERQTAALKRAESAGLLPAPTVAALLPPPVGAEATADEAARQQLSKIKQMMAEAEREKMARLEREAQERIGAEMAVDCEIAMRVERLLTQQAETDEQENRV